MSETAPSPTVDSAQLAVGIAPNVQEVGRIRRVMADVLDSWEVADEADDVLMVVSELVTNAVRHAPCPEIGFTATRGDRVLLIEVEDGSALPPVLHRHRGIYAESGRGLALVDMLASAWGWIPHEDGTKSTWAMIPLARRNT